jgi:hypothetical protein
MVRPMRLRVLMRMMMRVMRRLMSLRESPKSVHCAEMFISILSKPLVGTSSAMAALSITTQTRMALFAQLVRVS